MKALVLLFALLAGCAGHSTPNGLLTLTPQERIASAKSPQQFAACAAGALSGESTIANDGQHYWLVRIGSGLPLARWDFWPNPSGGSYAEVRNSQIGGAGKTQVRACA